MWWWCDAYWTNWQPIPKSRESMNALEEGQVVISIYIRSRMKLKPLLKTTGKKDSCTEQTKWWIWNSSRPVLLTWKITLWIICAWLNRLRSVKSTQIQTDQHSNSLVITEIREIPLTLRNDRKDCLIMHRLLQKGGLDWNEYELKLLRRSGGHGMDAREWWFHSWNTRSSCGYKYILNH